MEIREYERRQADSVVEGRCYVQAFRAYGSQSMEQEAKGHPHAGHIAAVMDRAIANKASAAEAVIAEFDVRFREPAFPLSCPPRGRE